MKKPFYQKVHGQIEREISRSGNLRAHLVMDAGPYHRGCTGLIVMSHSGRRAFAFVPDGPGPLLGVGLLEIQCFSIPSIGLYEGITE